MNLKADLQPSVLSRREKEISFMISLMCSICRNSVSDLVSFLCHLVHRKGGATIMNFNPDDSMILHLQKEYK